MLVVPLLRIADLTWPLFEDENSLQSLANFALHEQTPCLCSGSLSHQSFTQKE